MNKRCARCGDHKNFHVEAGFGHPGGCVLCELRNHKRCPQFLPKAPWWLRIVNQVMGWRAS